MKLRRLLFVVFCAGFTASTSYAQTEVMSLSDCLNKALVNNQRIAISRYEQEIGNEKIRQTRAMALPQVNAAGNLTDNYKRQVLVLGAGTFPGVTENQVVPVGNVYSTAVSADASQTLVDASVFTALKAARAGKEYYSQNTKQTEEDVIYQTAQTYYMILTTKEQLKTIDSNIANLTKIVEATKGQYENGLAKKIDLDRINVNLTNAKTQRLRQMNQIAIQMANLKVLMGIPVETQMAVNDLSFSEIEKEIGVASSYLNPELQNRTEIKLLDAQIHLTNLQTKAIQAENYPRLSAFFNYSYNGVTNKFNDYLKSGGSDIWYGMGAVGVRLNVPIFDGFARNARKRQSVIQMKELQKQKEGLELSLEAGYQSAVVQMENSTSSLRAQKQNVELAKDVNNSSEANYKLGLATLTDLLQAQTSYIEAQNSYAQALLEFKLAELETIRSSGKLRSLL